MRQEKAIHPLKRLREEAQLTGAELAALIRTRANNVSLVENGFIELSRQMFASVCDIFKLDPAQFDREINDYKAQRYRFLLNKLTGIIEMDKQIQNEIS